MPIRIVVRLGDVIPSDEYLEVGEPMYNPDTNQLGIGSGNNIPSWYPAIDRENQDLVLYGNSLLRSEVGGKLARFGMSGRDTFVINTSSGERLRVTDQATLIRNRVTMSGGGSLSGDFDTDGGRFTDMNVQEITISATTRKIVIRDGNSNAVIGEITNQGITSRSQQQFYMAVGAALEAEADFRRNMYSSGIVSVRSYNVTRPFDPKYKHGAVSNSAIRLHNHMEWRGIAGMSELTLLMNGYYLKTRHNDYRLMKPVASNTFGERVLNDPPDVPDTIKNLPLGYTGTSINPNIAGTQVEAMRNIYTSHPHLCVFELAYLEAWIQRFDGNVMDIATSTRHANENRIFQQMLDTQFATGPAGMRAPQENTFLLPGVVRGVDANGQPILGYINWRISSMPVATLSNQNQLVSIGGKQYFLRALPFDAEKSARGIIDSSNRFNLRRSMAQAWFRNMMGRLSSINNGASEKNIDFNDPDSLNTWLQIQDSALAMFDCADLEQLCQMCPGFDGEGVYDPQYMPDASGAMIRGTRNPVLVSSINYGSNGFGYYSNAYLQNTTDASGSSFLHRGFSDTNLFTAFTKHKEVVGGFSFMVPLELILRTPRESWNPFNIPYAEKVTGDGRPQTPYSGYNDYGTFFTLPFDSMVFGQKFTSRGILGDTSFDSFMQTPAGIKRMLASGILAFDYDDTRRRFPVIPESAQFTMLGREMEFLKMTLKSLFKRVASGDITDVIIDNAF